MAEADPSLVGSEIRHGDTSQMGANGRAHENAGVSCIRECRL